MKQKLFENVGGNQFKLINEGVIADENPKGKLVREGLKKVFGSGEKVISYKRLQGVGMGYIKSVEEAKKCAIQEARELASEYGYMEDEGQQAFVKEGDWHDEESYKHSHGDNEEDMSDPTEKREVQIGKEIQKWLSKIPHKKATMQIGNLAKELIALHTGKAATKPGTGGASYKAGSIY